MPAASDPLRTSRVTWEAYLARCSAAWPAELARRRRRHSPRPRRGLRPRPRRRTRLLLGGSRWRGSVADGRSRRRHYRASGDGAAAGQGELLDIVAADVEVDDFPGEHELGAEKDGLFPGLVGQRAAPGSARTSGRTRCGTPSSPPPSTLGFLCGTCRKPPPTPSQNDHAIRPGPRLAGPARHLHRRRLHRRSRPASLIGILPPGSQLARRKLTSMCTG